MLRHLLVSLLFVLQAISALAYEPANSSASITSIQYFHESGQTLNAQQALQRFNEKQATVAHTSALTFGIKNQAVWAMLTVDNPSSNTVNQRLKAGQTWIEHLDVYLLTSDDIVQEWHSGDAMPANQHLLPAVGFVFNLNLPSGKSQVLIRAQSLDPLTLPLVLETADQARDSDTITHVLSGLLYGILIILAAINFLLFAALKQRNALFYALYISTFIVMNSGYSGYAFRWLYPNSPTLQNFVTLFFMVLHAVLGLLFIMNFLEVKTSLPRLYRGLQYYILTGLILILGLCLSQTHLDAALVAFSFLTLTTLLLILLSIVSLNRVSDSQHLLFAVGCSMVGLLITSLSVWGFIPYTNIGFHAAEIGVVLEAIILAALVANRLKSIESERITANYLATYDPLTQLYNRRAYQQAADQLAQNPVLQDVPMSFVLMDLDHFKAVNDQYGHHAGDLVLQHIAKILKKSARKQDIITRWGGEEIALLLPNTTQAQALVFTESLRTKMAQEPLILDGQPIEVTASFGVATSTTQGNPEQLFQAADKLMYSAKEAGRNKVKSALL